ncbi:unnamed protein product [Effrenium voratum]|nr:unnamed protein product [Effrenium voratum]
MHRRGPLQNRRAREETPRDAPEIPLPGAQAPSASLQPQALASRHGFAAGPHGSLLSISGGSVFATGREGQQLQLGPRPRPLGCLSSSVCGRWWAVGEGCFGGRSGQVTVMGTGPEPLASLPVGVRRSARHVCWAARGELLAAIVEFESEQAAPEQQLMVWSWPSGERLASCSCGRGIQDLVGAPDGAVLLTLGLAGPKVWTLLRAQDAVAAKAPAVKVSLGGALPLRLVGRALPVTLPPSRAKRREEGLVAAAWGLDSCLFLATRHALGLTSLESGKLMWRDLPSRAFALAWSWSFCGHSRSRGIVACALHGGRVELLDAHDMTTPLWALDAGPMDAVGLACNASGSLWVLRGDRSLACFEDLQKPAWSLPTVHDLRGAQALPGNLLTRLVTFSSSSVQLWSLLHGDLRLEAATPAAQVTALAASPWLVAVGFAGGELRLLGALNGLQPLATPPLHHSAEVLGLSFGAWKPASLRPLLLSSVSADRSCLVFRIELQQGLQSTEVSPLLHLQNHCGPVQHVSLAAQMETTQPNSEIFRLVVCTSEQLIWREVEHTDGVTTVHKCARQQAARGSRWVGACADGARGVFYAACTSRRLLQLDAQGRRLQELRLAGAVEICSLHLSGDGRLLCAGLRNAAGILLLLAEELRPLARLAAGQNEAASAVAMHGDQVLAGWLDGTMLSWQVPEKAIPRAEPEERRTSPRPSGLYARGAASTSPRRRSGKGQGRSSGGSLARPWASSHTMSRTAMRGKVPEEKFRIRDAIKAQISQEEKAKDGERQGRGMATRPDGLQELRRLLASSPSPPKWAETSVVEDASEAAAMAEALEKDAVPMGKWARGSLVGAQVRSASELHHRSLELEAEAPRYRCASEGVQVGPKRRLFCACGRCTTRKLPPKPLFPPPLEKAPPLLAALPTPCRSKAEAKPSPQRDLEELVDSVVTLRGRLATVGRCLGGAGRVHPGAAAEVRVPAEVAHRGARGAVDEMFLPWGRKGGGGVLGKRSRPQNQDLFDASNFGAKMRTQRKR